MSERCRNCECGHPESIHSDDGPCLAITEDSEEDEYGETVYFESECDCSEFTPSEAP